MNFRKSNYLYVGFTSFTSDLLFWIVIDNLFLSTVKGFSAFEIVLITMLGIAISLLLYPITNLIVKKTSNKISIIIGSSCYCIAIILFMVCNSIWGFVIGQIIYNLSSPFKMVANVMLKNNLKEQNKTNSFIKWQSFGNLGYSVITLIVSLFAGFLFNIYAYLPMILSLACAIIGLLLAILYSEPHIKEEEQQIKPVTFKSLITNKTMILIMLMNLIAVGTYVFLQSRATLLIQYVCEEISMDISKISLMVSTLVFGSRLVRVISNLIFPKIYNKIYNKSNIILSISMLILLSNIYFAIGANLNVHFSIKLLIITAGFYIILFVRDIYSTMENNIIATQIPENEQKQAFVLANVYHKFGRFLSNAFALIMLNFISLNLVYACMLVFSVSQIFISIPLSKHFKH